MPEIIDLETVYLSVDPPMVTCTLNRPTVRNAFNPQMIRDITWAVVKAAKTDSVRVLVLAGEGESFCSGGDLSWLKKLKNPAYPSGKDDEAALAECIRALGECPLPSIARIHGACIGGGNGLAAACDIVIAAEDTVFQFPAARLGFVPPAIGPSIIRRIGETNARYLMLTGERFSGIDAVKYGLASRAVPMSELDNEVARVAEMLCSSGPKSIQLVKKLISGAMDQPGCVSGPGLEEIRQAGEGTEGIAAVQEKRSPKWVLESTGDVHEKNK